jgi:cytochrome c5
MLTVFVWTVSEGASAIIDESFAQIVILRHNVRSNSALSPTLSEVAMLLTLQRISGMACMALFTVGLAGCGGSEAGDGTAVDSGAAAKVAGANDAPVALVAVSEPASDGPDLAAGEATYGRFCFSCHAAGVAGAPKLGVAEDWAPRIAKGLDLLLASTIEGIPPGMPARGLCMNCSDDDLRNTVAWMIAQ